MDFSIGKKTYIVQNASKEAEKRIPKRNEMRKKDWAKVSTHCGWINERTRKLIPENLKDICYLECECSLFELECFVCVCVCAVVKFIKNRLPNVTRWHYVSSKSFMWQRKDACICNSSECIYGINEYATRISTKSTEKKFNLPQATRKRA